MLNVTWLKLLLAEQLGVIRVTRVPRVSKDTQSANCPRFGFEAIARRPDAD